MYDATIAVHVHSYDCQVVLCSLLLKIVCAL